MLSDESLVTVRDEAQAATWVVTRDDVAADIAGLRAVEAAVRADCMTLEEHASLCGQIEALTEQLAAAQAVIAEIEKQRSRMDNSGDWPDREVLARFGNAVETILAQSPTDALQAVKVVVWSEGFTAGRRADHNSDWWPRNPYRKDSPNE